MLTSGHIRESIPCSGLQHSGDVSLVESLNSTIKKVVDPTPIVCLQFLLSMKLSSREVTAIEAATRELWQVIRNGRLTR